ncbi:hypothetical protein DJ568_05210 [Mucilaginibacter hurinus]|uniref:Spore coat protein CotH n=1 Tax=Mucilaginibacter hurinus TaxID=2201324 RepID=A0A367GST4_9SPHI|nr:CotH kinase family protein [Mucilaginibacter hurinus]RCH56145.1 hypothetical protein DJ568_05210 [Mucilaginibacter hurinus]
MKKISLCLWALLGLFSCKKETQFKEKSNSSGNLAANAVQSVLFEASKNPGKLTADIQCTISGDEISALIPPLVDRNLVVTFKTGVSGVVAMVNDTVQVSGVTRVNFAKPVTYMLRLPDGHSRKIKFTVKSFTGLPILYLTTTSPVTSKDDYVKGNLVIDPNSEYEQEKLSIPLQVKGRGNTTWALAKKPYRMKFDSKADMLGMPAAKNWVLLANYSDKTLFRVNLAFELGRMFGVAFAQQSRFVELSLNGEYKGNYLLTSQVEVHENRVNIPELKEADVSADKITGGYLLELGTQEDAWFETKQKLSFTIKSPEDMPDVQYNYIKDYIAATEAALFSADFADPVKGYASFIDVESFINWYLVEELTKNPDARHGSSVYYYKDRGGKLCMGPLWDFDVAMGNTDQAAIRSPQGGWVMQGVWFNRLFQDKNFRKKVKERWNKIKNKELAKLGPYIDNTVNYINLSQQSNFLRWDILKKPVWPNNTYLGSYDQEVTYIKDWLRTRIMWMDSEIQKF